MKGRLAFSFTPALSDFLKDFYKDDNVIHSAVIPLDVEFSGFYLNNFIDPKWYYFLVERNEILSRGHFIKTGLLETIVFLAGLFFVVIDKLKNGWKKIKISFLDTAMLVGLISLFLTTELSAPLYKSIDLLSNIQFPWRMLSTFIFIPPIVVAALINKKVFDRTTVSWKKMDAEKQEYINRLKRQNPENLIRSRQNEEDEESYGWQIWKYLF